MHYFSFLIILAAVIIVIFLTFYLERLRKQNNWTGIIQDKKVKDYFYKGQHRKVYLLYILKDNGDRLTYNVNETIYKTLNVGDRVKKDKGDYFPTRTV